jgi:hypothetical protein
MRLMRTYRVFTNDRGRARGVPMYSALRDVKAASRRIAVSKINAAFGPPDFAPIVAIEWPATQQESKDWLKKHVGD